MADQVLTGDQERFVMSARVGRLGTAATTGQPHLIPVCFELVDGLIYVGLDSKPKSVEPVRLRRVRNILRNPSVAFLVDRYDEDWSRLGYVLVAATATLCDSEPERRAAVAALRAKYAQYSRLLDDGAPVIRITPSSVSSWGDLTP